MRRADVGDQNAAGQAVQYGYFAVQAKVTLGRDGVSVSGILENLGTGEKHPFSGRDGLATLIDNWSRGVAVGAPGWHGGGTR